MKKIFMDASQRSNRIIKNSFLRWALKEFVYIILFVWVNIIGMCWFMILTHNTDFISLIPILVGAVGIPQIAGYVIKYFQSKVENGNITYQTINDDDATKEITEDGGK